MLRCPPLLCSFIGMQEGGEGGVIINGKRHEKLIQAARHREADCRGLTYCGAQLLAAQRCLPWVASRELYTHAAPPAVRTGCLLNLAAGQWWNICRCEMRSRQGSLNPTPSHQLPASIVC